MYSPESTEKKAINTHNGECDAQNKKKDVQNLEMLNQQEEKKLKIAHIISTHGLMSRRGAEKIIEQGRVKINGLIARCAMRCSKDDLITLDNRSIKHAPTKIYILNKPPMYLVTHESKDDKKTIFDLIGPKFGYLTFCGRLDYLSEGLLVLTNSPEIAHKITTSDMRRVYKVGVNQINQKLYSFCENPSLDGYKLKSIEIISTTKTEITLGLREGKNREIRRIMQMFNMKISYLRRISYGPFVCDIPIGCIREVPNSYLKEIISL